MGDDEASVQSAKLANKRAHEPTTVDDLLSITNQSDESTGSFDWEEGDHTSKKIDRLNVLPVKDSCQNNVFHSVEDDKYIVNGEGRNSNNANVHALKQAES